MSDMDRIIGALQANAEHAETARKESADDRREIKQAIGALHAAMQPLIGLPERVEDLEAATASLKQESDERRGASRVTAAVYGAGGSGIIFALAKAATWIGILPR